MSKEKKTHVTIIAEAEDRLLRMSAKDLWNTLTTAGFACHGFSDTEIDDAVYSTQLLAKKVEDYMIAHQCKTVGDFFAEAEALERRAMHHDTGGSGI